MLNRNGLAADLIGCFFHRFLPAESDLLLGTLSWLNSGVSRPVNSSRNSRSRFTSGCISCRSSSRRGAEAVAYSFRQLLKLLVTRAPLPRFLGCSSESPA